MSQNPVSSGLRSPAAAVAAAGAAQPAFDDAGIPSAPRTAPQGYAMTVPESPAAVVPTTPAPNTDPAQPAVPVPSDAYQVTEDIVISDNLVAVTKAGTVIDTTIDGTVISLADGTRVIVAKDGTVTLDPDFRNPGAVVDANTMHGPGTYISPSGTQVQIIDGKVVITNPDGEKLTIYANGSCKIDVPEPALPAPAAVPHAAPDTAEPSAHEPGGSSGGPSGGSGGPSGGSSGGPSAGASGGHSGGASGVPPSEPLAPSIPTPTTPAPPTPPPAAGAPAGTPGGKHDDPPVGSPGPGTGGAGSKPATPHPAAGRDIQVTAGDLDRDAAYFSQQSANAATLAWNFGELRPLIRWYGLWFGARSPYEKAATQFESVYKGGSKQMADIGGALTKAAASYRGNESKGEELAEGIF